MNPIDDNLPRSDDHRFDLLVDGELSEPERGELLSRLDDEPGGWRSCALAFLQAQCLKREFDALVRGPKMEPSAIRPPRRRRPGGLYLAVLAMAASFLVALFLGAVATELWRRPQPAVSPPMQVADTQDQKTTGPGPGGPEKPEGEAPGQPEMLGGQWRLVTDTGPLRLRAVPRDGVDEQWLNSFPPAMPDHVREALKRIGYRVRQRREWIPYRMEDGRPLVMPVERYDIHYVGNPAY